MSVKMFVSQLSINSDNEAGVPFRTFKDLAKMFKGTLRSIKLKQKILNFLESKLINIRIFERCISLNSYIFAYFTVDL